MSEETSAESSPEKSLQLRQLLGQATLLRVRGRAVEAIAACRQALALDDNSWEAHELLGDLLSEQAQFEPALEEYRLALRLNPARGKIEEKIGRTALKQAAQLRVLEQARLVLEGKIEAPIKRNPALAALCSFILPGLGQVYNHQLLKGAVVVLLAVLLVAADGQAVLRLLAGAGSLTQLDLNAAFSAFFRPPALWWTLLLGILWLAAIAEAAFQASRTLTSDHTGLV